MRGRSPRAPLDILLGLKARGILSVGDFRFAVPPNPSTVRIRVGFTDYSGWDCWECQAPGTPIFHRIRTPEVVFALGSPADFDRLGVTFCGAYSSRAPHRFIIGTDRSPDWFRLLWFENRRVSSSRESKILERSHCLGRTGRHRRTGRNRSVPSLIPIYT